MEGERQALCRRVSQRAHRQVARAASARAGAQLTALLSVQLRQQKVLQGWPLLGGTCCGHGAKAGPEARAYLERSAEAVSRQRACALLQSMS